MYDREKMEIQEKAPPGAKYERMVKHIKKSFAKNGLTDKEKAIAYATTWKSYNKTHKEEFEIEEGMSMKDFKANRRNIKRREASADAEKRGHVSKIDVTHGRKYSPDEAKSRRANMSDYERSVRKSVAMNPDQVGDTEESSDKTKNPKKLRKQKAMGELGEATRYAKETGINFRKQKAQPKGGTAKDDKAFQMVSKLMGSGRAGVQPRGVKKDKGGPTPGPSVTPTQKVEKRRASSERAKEMQSSRFDHFEMDGDNLQEKYLYTYLYERNYDALDKDMDGDKDFADVMIARMLASGKSREDAVKATMSKKYNKKGKKVKISDEFSDWRSEFGEEVSKKSPYCDIMPKNEGDDEDNNDTKAAKKRQKPNEGKVTAEGLEQFAEAMGGYLVEAEAEQLNEVRLSSLGTAVKLAREVQLATKVAREAEVVGKVMPKPKLKLGTEKAGPLVVTKPAGKVATKTKTTAIVKAEPKTKTTSIVKAEPKTTAIVKAKTKTQTKTLIPTKGGAAVPPKPPRGGSGPGGIPLPKIGLSDIIGKVGYTQNPQ